MTRFDLLGLMEYQGVIAVATAQEGGGVGEFVGPEGPEDWHRIMMAALDAHEAMGEPIMVRALGTSVFTYVIEGHGILAVASYNNHVIRKSLKRAVRLWTARMKREAQLAAARAAAEAESVTVTRPIPLRPPIRPPERPAERLDDRPTELPSESATEVP